MYFVLALFSSLCVVSFSLKFILHQVNIADYMAVVYGFFSELFHESSSGYTLSMIVMPADMMETNGVHTVIHFITVDVKHLHLFKNVVLDWCLLNNNEKKTASENLHK